MVFVHIVLQSFLIYSVQSLYCSTPADCTTAYNSINLTDCSPPADCNIRLDGYKSGMVNGSITTTDFLYCNAAFSCAETPLITTTTNGNMALPGTQSGFNSSITSATNVDCTGSNSCSHSSIQAGGGERIYCLADQGCSYSTITATMYEIWGNGAYSLKNATIKSVENQLLRVNFYGYHSGYGAKIICQDSHSCVGWCYGNSCDYLRELQCLGNNPTCHINYIQPPDSITSTDILLFDSLALTTTNNDIHCEAAGSIKYDQRREHYNKPDLIVDSGVVPALCCRGVESCRQTNIEYNGTLICSGQNACHYVDFIKNYNGNIYCGGRMSCASTAIYSRNDVYCMGYSACDADFISSGTIYCTGGRSCWNSIINSTGHGSNLTVHFMGDESMMNVRINCKQNDVCRIVQDVMNDNDPVKVYCDGQCILECPPNFNCPILYPTSNPTTAPTFQPTNVPTYNPSIYPTYIPTFHPTFHPTTMNPTFIPTLNPTHNPTLNPTSIPSLIPTFIPTFIPTVNPTHNPTSIPSTNPTYQPTIFPTDNPSIFPTYIPTINPTFTYSPSYNPTILPTNNPTITPSNIPTVSPVNDGNAGFKTTFEVTYSKGKFESEKNSLIRFITDNILWLLIIIGFLIIICVLLIFCYTRKTQKQVKHKADIINTNIELEKVQSIEIMSETEPGETDITDGTNTNAGEIDDAYSNKNALKYWLNDIGMNEYFPIFVKEGFGDDISQMEALLKLTNDQLKSIGIKKLAHRNLILSKIEKLNISSQIENRNENDYLLNNNNTNDNKLDINNSDDENEEMYMEKELETKGVIVNVNANDKTLDINNTDDENDEMYMEIQNQTENGDNESENDNDLYKKSTKATNQ